MSTRTILLVAGGLVGLFALWWYTTAPEDRNLGGLLGINGANAAGVKAIVPPPVVRIDQNELALGGPVAGVGTARITLGKFSLGRFL